MIYKINLNALLSSRKKAVSEILPVEYISQTWSDCDYAVLHQINSIYTEIILVRICPDNNYTIEYVSFLHPTRINVLNEYQRKLFKDMMDFVLENSTESMFFSIQIPNELPENVRVVLESFKLSHKTHNTHRIGLAWLMYYTHKNGLLSNKDGVFLYLPMFLFLIPYGLCTCLKL